MWVKDNTSEQFYQDLLVPSTVQLNVQDYKKCG